MGLRVMWGVGGVVGVVGGGLPLLFPLSEALPNCCIRPWVKICFLMNNITLSDF